MRSIVTIAKLYPSPVWLRQLYGKALPPFAPDLILQADILILQTFEPAGMVSTSRQDSAFLRCRRTLFLRSGVPQPFNAHRAGTVPAV